MKKTTVILIALVIALCVCVTALIVVISDRDGSEPAPVETITQPGAAEPTGDAESATQPDAAEPAGDVEAAAQPDAAAANPTVYTSGDYEYVLLQDGTAMITKYTGSQAAVTIPEQLDGYRVTALGDYAYNAMTSLTAVTIPDCITIIGANPFRACFSLREITVASTHPTLAVIDGVLFEKTEKRLVCYPCAFTAASYAIPQGIRIIGDNAFYSSKALSGVIIPDSVISIGRYTFMYCDALTGMSFPESLTTIGDGAYWFCSNLRSITIPRSVTVIGVNPFAVCTNLQEIHTAADNPVFASIDGVLFEKAEKRLISYPASRPGTSYTIPQGIRHIDYSAFHSSKTLQSVIIPDSIITIGENAFYGCTSLTRVTVTPGSYAEEYAIANGLPYVQQASLDWLSE